MQPWRDEWKPRYAAHSYNHYNAIQAWSVTRDGQVHDVEIRPLNPRHHKRNDRARGAKNEKGRGRLLQFGLEVSE